MPDGLPPREVRHVALARQEPGRDDRALLQQELEAGLQQHHQVRDGHRVRRAAERVFEAVHGVARAAHASEADEQGARVVHGAHELLQGQLGRRGQIRER